jgi:hypothetical protein
MAQISKKQPLALIYNKITPIIITFSTNIYAIEL